MSDPTPAPDPAISRLAEAAASLAPPEPRTFICTTYGTLPPVPAPEPAGPTVKVTASGSYDALPPAPEADPLAEWEALMFLVRDAAQKVEQSWAWLAAARTERAALRERARAAEARADKTSWRAQDIEEQARHSNERWQARAKAAEAAREKAEAALLDMLDRFAPTDDGLGEAEIACAARARAALAAASPAKGEADAT